jgi:predicted ferric reductase
MDGNLAQDVDFYYTVRHREEAVFVDEIETAAEKNPRLKAHIRFSSVDGSLTVDEIVKNAGGNPSTRFASGQALSLYHVYMCGPLPMVQAFEKKFLEAKVPAANIHFEEFNFR